MRTQDLREQNGAGRVSDARLSFLPVIIYTSGCVLKGRVRCEIYEPLATILNRGSADTLAGSLEAFLPILSAEAISSSGSREALESTYVRKDNILFAAQSKLQMVRRGKGGKSKLNSDASDEAVSVVAYMPSHILVGKLEAGAWRTLAEDLGCCQRFLSLSEVRVLSPSSEGEDRFALVAVNSGRILHITQLPRGSEITAGQLTVDGILSELLGLRCDSGSKRSIVK